MNAYGMDAKRFPLVVDSDLNQAGTFVPGMGQPIRFRDIYRCKARNWARSQFS